MYQVMKTKQFEKWFKKIKTHKIAALSMFASEK